MRPVRLGAVEYLNARPLVYGLELRNEFALQFDPPSKCAALLHEGSIDVGLIPTIEYLRAGSYCVVPDVAIASEGAVASVALFSTQPIPDVRSVAADISSRTSTALLQILCYEALGIDPEFIPMPPKPDEMLRRCDAALLIGDAALFLDHELLGVTKLDLGECWTDLTGLPFVWAFWAGRPGVLSDGHVRMLLAAKDAGTLAPDSIAAAYCGPGRAAHGARYLKENMRYDCGARELEGLATYYELAQKHGVVARAGTPVFYSR